MMKTLLLIDPVTQTITEVEYDGNSRNIAPLLSDTEHGIRCSTFTAVYLDDGLTIFIGDDSLRNEPQYFFRYEGYAQPLAGRGIALATNRKGDSLTTMLNIDDLTRKITFHRLGAAKACGCGTRCECNVPHE